MANTPPEAAEVFGERTDLAEKYVRFLATAGLERGLLGPREADRLWTRHVLNCTAVASAIDPPREGNARGIRVVDIGSGAGLPGIPLVLARPDLTVTMVEPLLRRTIFLEEAIDSLGLRERGLEISVVRGRAEEKSIREDVGGADVVTARAVAPLAKLGQWCTPLLRPGGAFVALKGESAADELKRDGQAMERAGLSGAASTTVTVPGAEPTYLVTATRSEAHSRRGGHGQRDKLDRTKQGK
ncbi:16S rRNA (guanine(527)-N(7))-methyltransferase RsmG [Dietzia sp.]|uniref:16S rRNA (guanine(527)-N(7))-methyltransferase RsmG n=1 Tax=Dietzia sp. TaxID=1871616 RepID=UPI002FD99015